MYNGAHAPWAHKGMPDGGESGGGALPGEGAGHHAGDLGGQIRGAVHGPHQEREGRQTLWRFLLTKALTLLSHHTLMRGASIREITLPDIFLYRLASTSSVNKENQPVVMEIAARNSKTSKDARLQQSYAAQHLEAELCAVGETGLWLHFILDQIGQFNGVDFLLPLDTTEREGWYKKHLFFARNDKEKKELSTASHQCWTRQMWMTNKVFCKRNVHAARAGGAKKLAIEGTPRAEIAELGHWALDKMTCAYITAIPVGVVTRKAGYSGCKEDYFLGRSKVEPTDKLLDIITKHIFLDGRPIQFDTWLDNLQMYLLSDSRDNVFLFDLTSGTAPAPPVTADSATRSQWLTRDAAACLAIRNHLPLAECAHFGQHRTAQALYDTFVSRYSLPATDALGRLLLPYLFPELSAFATVEDLVSHLRASDARYCAALPAEFLDRNPPPMYITLYFIVNRLPDSLRSVRDHFLSLDPTSLTVDLLE
ncbi:unnamed protein product [Closterium sp. NIES-54]